MRSTKREQGTLILVVAFGFAAGICGAQAPAGTPATPAAAAADAQPAQAVVAPPPEAPITPPKVVCAGGQITISANNSTLSSVLAELHRCLGARIDIPGDAGAKRIYDKIGPGPASQVLDELLSNNGYNYIIGASPDNDEKIESIVLLARTGDSTAASSVVDDPRAGSTSHRLFSQMHQNSIPHPMTDADSAAAAELGKPKEAAPAAAPNDATTPAAAPADGQQPPTTPAPETKPADAAPAQPDAPATPASSNNTYTSKPQTTEEQIVNMQQMFELRRQMTQQQQQQQAAPPPQN